MITVTPYFADRTERKRGITEDKTSKKWQRNKNFDQKDTKIAHFFSFSGVLYAKTIFIWRQNGYGFITVKRRITTANVKAVAVLAP
ncbi:hypothetical protein [Cellvibrio fontiphilus]|uniref:Uncharacterized protein n=1 Tax=Cellvibrio fontiphilus TaxID=1815559 RepID=A0ABV7FGY1_9GAMM